LALSLKLRTRQLEIAHRDAALVMFSRLCAENLDVVPVSRGHFRMAAQFTDQHALALRAADALHLAICSDLRAALATLDNRLGEAGRTLGISSITV
jgi:predicted nucleic acid-binding protein